MDSTEAFEITQHDARHGLNIRVSGELSLVTAPRLRRRLLAVRERGILVTLDLTEVTFIDSVGLASVVKTFRTKEERGRVIIRASLHAQPKILFDLMGMTTLFAVLPTSQPETS